MLCDFGGTTAEPEGQPGYCSDITRCVYTGEPSAEFAEAYAALQDAQAMAVDAAVVGAPAESVDKVARDRLAEADLDQWFLHRLGHGIGVEAHEDPYLVEGNEDPLAPGNAFSIEPGVLHRRPVGSPDRGHRRQHRRRAAGPQPGQPRPGRRRGVTRAPALAAPAAGRRLDGGAMIDLDAGSMVGP